MDSEELDDARQAIAEALADRSRSLVLELEGVPEQEVDSLGPAMRQLTELRELELVVDKLPAWLAELTWLEGLDLSYADIDELPEFIGELANLQVLDLTESPVTRLPVGLARLSELRELALDFVDLEEFPDFIGDFRHLRKLSLIGAKIRRLPDCVRRLDALETLDLGMSDLEEMPHWIGELTSLTELTLAACGQLAGLPEHLAELRSLRYLAVGDLDLPALPDWIGRLTALQLLSAPNNQFEEFPSCVRELSNLTSLDLASNEQLGSLPEWIGELTRLERLELNRCGLTGLPAEIGALEQLTSLHLMANEITELPDSIGRLSSIRSIDLDGNRLVELPDSICELRSLSILDLRGNRLTRLPDGIGRLGNLGTLYLQFNRLTILPRGLGDLALQLLSVTGNPLPPEVLAADEDGPDGLGTFLRLVADEGELIREAKLVLVGEGAVGKSSLLGALRGEAFVEGRNTTHGIEIKPVEVTAPGGAVITLNGWDFGGQQIYRPTHQLFFTEPAVYLVVWKPREGPELGQVDEWIRMIRHRAGSSARIHVVATHGGPGARYAHIDEAALRERYGEMIAGFHHVDSRVPDAALAGLRDAIARTAAGLAHVQRWYPRSWSLLRQDLGAGPEPYLRYEDYLSAAAARGLSERSAESLVRNGHALGHWIHYADDPGLNELVILKADWLSVAVGFVLDDPETVQSAGLLRHRRLARIWADPARDPEQRYPHQLQQMFLRLMERFELSYRVPELTGGEPLSLVAQLVQAHRPDLTAAWGSYRPGDPELAQIIGVFDRESRRQVWPDGLMHRLIVLFHRHSLGRENVTEAVHWSGGMVLAERYGARALITLAQEGLVVRVRGLNPQAFLDHLVREVRDYVDGFWKGLETRVQLSCTALCRLQPAGRGRFDLDKLYRQLDRGRVDFPCSEPSCDEDLEITALLHGLDRRGPAVGLGELVRSAVDDVLESHIDRVIAAQSAGTTRLLGRLDGLDDDLRMRFSRVDAQLSATLHALADEAVNGPRLFSLEELDRTLRHPGLTTRRLRLTLYCEHSRLPVHRLETGRPDAGVYEIEVPREWWVRAAPLLRATAALVKTLLPVSLAALEYQLDDQEWDSVKKQLALAKESLGAAAEAGQALPEELDADGRLVDWEGPAELAEGGLLRELHALLADEDIGYADLRRVTDAQGRYLWVHRRFVDVYQPPLPVIPVGLTRLGG